MHIIIQIASPLSVIEYKNFSMHYITKHYKLQISHGIVRVSILLHDDSRAYGSHVPSIH